MGNGWNHCKKKTLTQQVGESIKSLIEKKELKPGDWLSSEKELTRMFSVSRTVVREALKSLESVGIVRLKPGGGVYVSHPTYRHVAGHISFQWRRDAKKMKELIEVRKYLEAAALEMTIRRNDPDLIAELGRLTEEMERKIAEGSVPVEEDLQFHRSLFKATGNETFFEIGDFLTMFFEQFGQTHPEHPEYSQVTVREHREIWRAIADGDIERAKSIMETHLARLEQYVRRWFPDEDQPADTSL